MISCAAGLGIVALLTVALTACARPDPVTTTVTVTVEEVIAARERQAERFGRERVERLRQNEGRRIAAFGLPAPAYRGTVPVARWTVMTEACIREQVPQVSSVSLTVDAAGELVTWRAQGDEVGDPERLALAVDVCAVRNLPAVPGLGGIDDIERVWWREDALTRLLPCLRRAATGPLPSLPTRGLAESAAEGRPWDPLQGLDPLTQRRASALCPSGEVLIERAHADEVDAEGGRAPRPPTPLDVPVADF